jgi:predicted ester cyclase
MGDARKLTLEFWELFESGRLGDLSERIDPDCHFKMPGAEMRGREAIIGLLTAYRTAFPDLKHNERSVTEQGDSIAIELLVEGTHTGPMQTPQGTIPATGKHVTWESCDVVRVKNGKLVSWHVYHDPAPFFAALGVTPPQ